LRAAPILLVAALLPSIVYLDHWADRLNHGPEHIAAEAGSEHVTHHAHCHLGPASCSQQPVPPNLRGFDVLVEVPAPELPATPLEDSVDAPEEFIASPLTEPPRSDTRFS
jgi:hypothetical protein